MIQLMITRIWQMNHIIFWGLLDNLEDILRSVDAIMIILGLFDIVLYSEYPFYPSRDGIPLDVLDGF